ncbi:polysaccharide lyase 6 family protein [Pontiellaceae bacterium B1224]|nr:polysaccharide lyase 6 family protein [Pontiellaceae bacterium B1224]
MKRDYFRYIVLLVSVLFTAVTRSDTLVGNMTELNTAIDAAQPGDTILMQNGVWNSVVIDFDADGLLGQPITLRAEVDGQVSLEGASKLQIAGDYLVVRGLVFTNGAASSGSVIEFRGGSSDLSNNSRLTECVMIGFNPVDPTVNYKWVSIYGVSNRVDHCHFSGMNHIGVTLTVWPTSGGPPGYARIDGNYFGDRAPGTGNGFETIRIGTSGVSDQEAGAVVESNCFYRCNGEIEIISNKTIGNEYRRNSFVECAGQLTLRHGGSCRVEGNFFFGNNVSGSSGVRVIGPNHVIVNNYFADLEGTGTRAAIAIMNGVPDSPLNRYLQATNDVIAFNTFVNCEETFAIGTESSGGDTTLPPADCVIANNVVLSNRGPLIDEINEPVNMLYEGNIMFGAATGLPPTPGIIVVDPLLSLASDGLWRPGTNSPVLNAALGSYPDVLIDMDRQSRETGSKDVGADEIDESAPLFSPLGPEDVGPRWMRSSTLLINGFDVGNDGATVTDRVVSTSSTFHRVVCP